jgi:glycosyltransferase involved in cell wall biosynthesis
MSINQSNLKVSLCLLTWNEVEGCKIDIPKLPKNFDRIYAIDNSSVDGTIEFLQRSGIEVLKQNTKSYNGAYKDAILAAGDSAVVFFHPKGTIDVESLEIAIAKMKSGSDFVLASRISKQAVNEEDHRLIKPRKWFVILIALICKARWGIKRRVYLDDPLHGYRGLSSKFMETLNLKNSGITADVEMIRHAYLGQFTIDSFPVREVERLNGGTHFPAFATGKQILKYVFWN